MGRNRAMKEEAAALRRVIALLFVLAGLAEHAGGRSAFVCGVVLWLLRHAEASARGLVAGDPAAPPSMQIVQRGDRAADAIRLAASLRSLARQLAMRALLRYATRVEGGDESGLPPFARTPAMTDVLDAFSRAAAFALREPHSAHAPDTS